LLLIDSTKLEIIYDIIFPQKLRYKRKNLLPMIKNTYPTHPKRTKSFLPNPQVLDFLKKYSASIEVLKGKKNIILIQKN